MFNNLKKLISLVFATVLLTSISSTSFAIDKLHFIIGGGAGGGWDGTARGTGEALTKAGFLKSASFENMSGGGGGKALSYIINSKPENTVLVQSTPLVLRSITRHKGYVKEKTDWLIMTKMEEQNVSGGESVILHLDDWEHLNELIKDPAGQENFTWGSPKS